MASEISLYSFEDADGDEYGTFTTQDYREAKEYAAKYHLRVIENVYEWTEAVPVEGDDYTGADEKDTECEYTCPECGNRWSESGGGGGWDSECDECGCENITPEKVVIAGEE